MRIKFDPVRYSVAYLMAGLDEAEVQAQIVHGLRSAGFMVFPQDAGLKALRGKLMGLLMRHGIVRHIAASICKALFSDLPEGWPDLIGTDRHGHMFMIEVKAPATYGPSDFTPGKMIITKPAGTPSKEQVEFLRNMELFGVSVGIAWSLSDAMQIVQGRIDMERGA